MNHVEGVPKYVGSFPWTHPLDGYGYQWWIASSINAFVALGHQGKVTVILPNEEMVLVFTSNVSPAVVFDLVDEILYAVVYTDKTEFLHYTLIIPIILSIVILRKK